MPFDRAQLTPTEEQAAALEAIERWFNGGVTITGPGIWRLIPFLLDGGAGTGKTTVAQMACQRLGVKRPVFGSYTAKAARVMAVKGMEGASTLHRLLYTPKLDANGNVIGWKRLGDQSPCARADLIVVDECFASTTMVDTINGPCYIADIRPGDRILNASGIDVVAAISRKRQHDACQIKFRGKTITTSRNHPFFTFRGQVCAKDLRPGDQLIETSSAMRLLWNNLYTSKLGWPFLFPTLLLSLVEAIPRVPSKSWGGSETMAAFRSPQSTRRDSKDNCLMSCYETRSSTENQRYPQEDWAQTSNTRRQWQRHDYSSTTSSSYITFMDTRTCSSYRLKEERGSTYTLQDRPRESTKEDSYRNTGTNTCFYKSTRGRQTKGEIPNFFRVDSVELLEQGDSRLDEFRDAEGELYFYDIQATQHSSFSVEGVLVHNCSMLPPEQLEDLLMFDKPILVLGDVDGQLPPIDGRAAFAGRQPDFRLHDVHRTADQSPITALAWSVRRNGDLPPASPMVRRMKDDAWPTILNRDWQVLCGKHSSRLVVTRRARTHYGFSGSTPSPGEPLICRRNSYRYGVMNGDLCVLWHIEENNLSQPYFVATLLLDGEELEGVRCARRLFEAHSNPKGEAALEDNTPKARQLQLLQLDWAYAITVYTAQGSEWPNVILIDDRFGAWDRDLRRRFLYTGITRSSENLIVYTTG